MCWRDLYLDKVIADSEIRSVLAQLHSIEIDAVAILKSPWQIDERDAKKVVCITRDVSGDFPLWVEIIPLDVTLYPENGTKYVLEFCRLAKCNVLIDDDNDETKNPFLYKYVTQDGTIQPVTVDPDYADREVPHLKILQIRN